MNIKTTDAADLQVADGWRVVDLHVGGVGGGKPESVSEPNHGGSWVSLHLTGDVGWVSFPRVRCHGAQDLWSICSSRQEVRAVNITTGVLEDFTQSLRCLYDQSHSTRLSSW